MIQYILIEHEITKDEHEVGKFVGKGHVAAEANFKGQSTQT